MAALLDLQVDPHYLAKSEANALAGRTETVWKKTEDEADAGAPTPVTPQSPIASTPPPSRPSTSRAPAVIGSSIVIKGDIEGGEDLTIQGRVEGKVRLPKNHVSVGQGGFLKGDIHGKSVHVDGEVRGNLYGSQEVILRTSGMVQGNIVSPRVTLENGSRFKGSIDMEGAATEEKPVEPGPGAKPVADQGASGRTETAAKPAANPSKAPDKVTAAGGG